MSLILDALKKLDREKTSRRDVSANIAAGILRASPQRAGRRNLLYIVAASLSAVAAAGVTYGLLEYGSLRKAETIGPVAAQSPPPAQREVPPATPTPRPAQQQVASAAPAREPAREIRPAADRAPEKVQSPAEGQAQPVLPPARPKPAGPPAARAAVAAAPPQAAIPVNPQPSREQAPPVRDSRESGSAVPAKTQNPPEIKTASPAPEKPPARKAAPEAPPLPAAAVKPVDAAPPPPPGDPPSLKLSGIVWHEDPAARRAVVNGTFASEGSMVEGVKVVEIHPNRVSFSHNGRSFEIVMFR